MLKVYQSINSVFFATDFVLAENRKVHVAFDGGTRYPKKVNGTYITSDPEIQGAIEKDASFNKEFKLVRTEQTESKNEADKEGSGNNGDGQTEFPEITKVGEARELLKEKFQKSAANRAEVFQIAGELGIVFPNLPVEG